MNINFKNIGSRSPEQADLKDRRYGISVKYYSDENETPHKRIDYDVEVKIDEHNSGWQISIDKQNIFFNQHEPDLINEILSMAITQSIYPVQCVINSKGLPVKGIINHDEILKRWSNNKKKITDKYAGETIDGLIAAADEKFGSKALIEKSMKYDMFWNLFFHPKHIAYGDGSGVQTDLNLAVVPYKFPLRFTGRQNIDKAVTSYNTVAVTFNSDEMEAPEYLTGASKAANQQYFMKLDVVFDLDATHLFPMHTTAHFNLFLKDDVQAAQSKKRIQFTMYQLNTASNTNQFNMVVDDEQPKNKKSKLMKFIDVIVGD